MHTDSFSWDMNPHTPRLYLKPAPPLVIRCLVKLRAFLAGGIVQIRLQYSDGLRRRRRKTRGAPKLHDGMWSPVCWEKNKKRLRG